MQHLLADVDAGKVDVIVVYKIDRLSRLLLDFMKMIERFNQQGVSFVSVTQHFNTTDPTGRMFLGILITFAQYEREVIAERIRDKVAAAKRRGKYCGGPAILGYDVDRERKKLRVNPEEAPLVKHIFRRFTQLASAKSLAAEEGKTSAREPVGHIYRLLGNRRGSGAVSLPWPGRCEPHSRANGSSRRRPDCGSCCSPRSCLPEVVRAPTPLSQERQARRLR